MALPLHSKIPPDRALLEEAAGLLHGLRVSTALGAGASGDRVHVMADPVWDETRERVRLLLFCMSVMPIGYRWPALPVLALPAFAADSPGVVSTLGCDGTAVLAGLAAGEYKLSVSHRCYLSDGPVIFPGAAQGEGPQTIVTTVPAADADADADVAVTVNVRWQERDLLALEFEAANPEPAATHLRFALVDAAGTVLCSDEVALEAPGRNHGSLARCCGKAALSQPCRLMYQLLDRRRSRGNDA